MQTVFSYYELKKSWKKKKKYALFYSNTEIIEQCNNQN